LFSGAVEAVFVSPEGRHSSLPGLGCFDGDVVLLVSYPSELLEAVRFRHYFDDDEDTAWF
jgi:hypothetical protein